MVFTSLIAVRLTLLAPYVLLFIPLTMTHVCVCFLPDSAAAACRVDLT